MRSSCKSQAHFFSGINFLLALAIHFGTIYIFSAVRQLGSFNSALPLAVNRYAQCSKKNDRNQTILTIRNYNK
jgi:hypothetical protein